MMGFGDANPHHRWNGFLIHGQFNAFLPRQSVNITLAAKTSCRNTIPNADLALALTRSLRDHPLPDGEGTGNRAPQICPQRWLGWWQLVVIAPKGGRQTFAVALDLEIQKSYPPTLTVALNSSLTATVPRNVLSHHLRVKHVGHGRLDLQDSSFTSHYHETTHCLSPSACCAVELFPGLGPDWLRSTDGFRTVVDAAAAPTAAGSTAAAIGPIRTVAICPIHAAAVAGPLHAVTGRLQSAAAGRRAPPGVTRRRPSLTRRRSSMDRRRRSSSAAPGLPSSKWSVVVEALGLERNVGSSIQLGYNSSYSRDILQSDDDQLPLEAGLRLQLGWRIDDHASIEATYWGLIQWSVGSQIYGDPIGDTVLVYSPYLKIATQDGYLNDNLSYTYKSQVNNVEINERLKLYSPHPYWDLSWLWGFRYLSLNDNFTLSGQDDDNNGYYESRNCKTTNNLVGGQLGLQSVRGWQRFQFIAEIKAGLFANVYSQKDTDNANDASGNVPNGFTATDTSHNGTPSRNLRGLDNGPLPVNSDSQSLAADRLSGVLRDRPAPAPNQLDGLSHTGTVVLDGLSLGLEGTW